MPDAAVNETVVRITRFGDVADAHRLEFLKLIEQTMDRLGAECREVSMLADYGETLAESVERSPSEAPIDPTDEIAEKLGMVETGIRNDVLPVLGAKRQAAINDPHLRDDHEDGVVAAYDELVEAWKKLYNSFVNLRWAVMEHDSDIDEPAGKIYDSPDELIESLSS